MITDFTAGEMVWLAHPSFDFNGDGTVISGILWRCAELKILRIEPHALMVEDKVGNIRTHFWIHSQHMNQVYKSQDDAKAAMEKMRKEHLKDGLGK